MIGAMDGPLQKPSPARRTSYRRHLAITTRWMDNDVFGHINNVAYYSFFDTAVCTMLVTGGALTWDNPEHIMVVAESGCRYHSELAFPDPVMAGLRVARLGTSSVRYEIGIFRGEDEAASAEGFVVHVCISAATRRPAPLPPAWRALLEPLVAEGG
jgi:acyl-CoA thioester hydrolase